jgi:hypothetical protein
MICYKGQEIGLRALLEALVVSFLDRCLFIKTSLPPIPCILIDETNPIPSSPSVGPAIGIAKKPNPLYLRP